MENNKKNEDHRKTGIDRRGFLSASALSTAALVAGSSFLYSTMCKQIE